MAIQKINLGSMPLGAGGDTQRAANEKTNQNFSNSTHAASRLVGKSANDVPQVSNLMELVTASRPSSIAPSLNVDLTGLYFSSSTVTTASPPKLYMNVLSMNGYSSSQIQIALPYNDPNHNFYIRSRINNNQWDNPASRPWAKIYHSENTTKDSNGFIKASSPVLRVFSDHIEGNGDGEKMGAEFVKKGVGNYLIKGTTGLADEGWYVTIPQDANGNNLVAVEYESSENGDVALRTYKRKFDFETVSIVADHDNPLDIPDTRWIDLRFNEIEREVTNEPIE